MAQTYYTEAIDPTGEGFAQVPARVNANYETIRSSFSGATAPTSPTPVAGQLFHDTDEGVQYFRSGSNWIPINTAGANKPSAPPAGLTHTSYSTGTASNIAFAQWAEEIWTGAAWIGTITRKFTIAFNHPTLVASTTVGATAGVTVFNLPSNSVVEWAKIKHTVAFTGTGLSTLIGSVGVSASGALFTSAINLFAAPSDSIINVGGTAREHTHAAYDALCVFTPNAGAALSNLSAGSVDVWLRWHVLP